MSECMKGTPFMCPCDECMAEQNENGRKHFARLAQLKSGVAAFWTDQYSAHDKMVTMVHVGAGHEPDPHCYCLKCRVARDQQEVTQ